MSFETKESVFRIEALKVMRSDLARCLSVDVDSISDPWDKARVIRVRENVSASAGLNDELLPLFPGSGAIMFDELPMLKIDYSRGIGILMKWLVILDNSAVLSEVLKMILAYYDILDEFFKKNVTKGIVSAIPRLCVYGRMPLGFPDTCVEFAKKVSSSDLDMLLPLLADESLPDAVSIAFFDRFSRAKRREGMRRISHFLKSVERAVVKKAIAICSRGKAVEYIPELEELTKSPYVELSKPATKALQKLVLMKK